MGRKPGEAESVTGRGLLVQMRDQSHRFAKRTFGISRLSLQNDDSTRISADLPDSSMSGNGSPRALSEGQRFPA